MLVRPARPGDAAGVQVLAAATATSFEPDAAAFDRAWPALLADRAALLLVADQDGDVVGYLLAFVHQTFFANGPVCWIEELAVDVRHQRRGTGRALTAAAEEWAAGHGAGLVALATRRAQDFYAALGYRASAEYLSKRVRA
ncbi:GNAT family N-acetyltransferase [Angustibacter aerolatus]